MKSAILICNEVSFNSYFTFNHQHKMICIVNNYNIPTLGTNYNITTFYTCCAILAKLVNKYIYIKIIVSYYLLNTKQLIQVYQSKNQKI